MPGIKHATSSRKLGFVLPEALRAAAQREVARVRASRSLLAHLGEMFGRSTLSKDLMPRYTSRASYYKHCKAYLTKWLAPYWQGSHAGLKRYVRGALQSRRRDIPFLSGVLRATRHSAALALFIFATSVTTAQADNVCYFTFSQYVGASNPFNGLVLGNFSAPAFADLDADGNVDVVVGGQGGNFDYYLNTGTKTVPVFVKQASVNNPFNGIDVGYAGTVTFGDLDADGDLDALMGSVEGTIRYFRNEGNKIFPVFNERLGGNNPFNGIDLGGSSAPAFADLDGDDDLDVLVGVYEGNFLYFLNNGNAGFPSFSQQTGSNNPMVSKDVGTYSRPAFIDIDADGDLDLFSGRNNGEVLYYENTGTPLAPAFVESDPFDNPMLGFDAGDYSHPAFGDLDGDGDLDALIGGLSASVVCAQNVTNQPLPLFEEKLGSANPFSGVIPGLGNNGSAPTLGDLDGDGDLDALIGDLDGTVRYFKNTGTSLTPVFEKLGGAANPLNGFSVPVGNSRPKLTDLDGDGDLDLLIGMRFGMFFYLQNIGTALDPEFQQQTGSSTPLDGVDVGEYSTLAIADLDGDGDSDVLLGNKAGSFYYLQNYGSAVNPQIFNSPVTPLNGVFGQYEVSPEFIDIDRDGDLDAMIGLEDGSLKLFMNTGSATAPVFDTLPNGASPLSRVNLGGSASPTFADLDGDGDLDAIVGRLDGGISYFEQTGDCALFYISCRENLTLPLGQDGTVTIRPEDLDDGNNPNTTLSVSPSKLFCSDLGASIPVTLTITNLVGAYGTCQVNVTVQDLSGPVITLGGAAEVTLECGDVYTELGASVVDGCDATVDVVIGGNTVNTNLAGTYIVTYSAEDGGGNISQITRTVHVQGTCAADGEGASSIDYDDLLNDFSSGDNSGDGLLTLAEVFSQWPAFSLDDFNAADANGDDYLSVAELLQANGRGILMSSDTNGDSILQLTELLRITQLYNAGAYACAANAGATEDGYKPGLPQGSDPDCLLHSNDTNNDNNLSLSELLRTIQFFNLGGYTWCPGTGSEDDFCG